MSLTKMRDDLIAEHKAMEKYDPHWKAAAERGDRISERPVAFLCDEEVAVFGECVTKIVAGLNAFLAREPEYADRAAREPAVAQAIKVARRVAAGPIGEPPGALAFTVSQQHWNAIAFALGEVGVTVVMTQGSY